jgi:hypothetical protein
MNSSLQGLYWAFVEVHYPDVSKNPRPRVVPIRDVKELAVHCIFCGKDGPSSATFTIKSPERPRPTYGAISTHTSRHHSELQQSLEREFDRGTKAERKVGWKVAPPRGDTDWDAGLLWLWCNNQAQA